MNSITEFKREFSRVMRGYSPEEVDAAVEMLVSYGAELESANAEFAEVNDALLQQNETAAAELDRLRRENATLREELESSRAGLAEMKQRLAEANAHADGLCADAESVLGEITARCDAEEKRYAALTRKTSALTEAVRALYTEHMQAIDALADANDVPAEVSALSRPAVRRAAVMAAAVSPEPDEPEIQAPHAVPRAPRRQLSSAQRTEPSADPVPAESDASAQFAQKAEEEPTRQFSIPTETVMLELESAQLDAVYRPAKPSSLKVIRENDGEGTPTHSFAAVRRTLDEIGSKLK